MRFLIISLLVSSLFATDELVTWNPRIPRKNMPLSPPVQNQKRIEKIMAFPKSRIQIGGSYTYGHISPSNQHSFHGHLGGVKSLYEFRPINRFYGGAGLIWKQGMTKGLDGSRFLLMLDAHERIGFTWGKRKKMRFFSLFSGLGYRHFGNTVRFRGSTVSANYNHLYIPVGFVFEGKVNSITTLGLHFQWMAQIHPTLTLKPLNGAEWTLNKKQTNFKGDLPIVISLTKKHRATVQIIPSFEYWCDGQTNAKTKTGTFLRIPGNVYLFPGIDINFGYAF